MIVSEKGEQGNATISASEVNSILLAVRNYLDGMYEGNTRKLEEAFHPTAQLHSFKKGRVEMVSFIDWCEFVASNPSPGSVDFDRGQERIFSVDEFAPGCATVLLHSAVPDRSFVEQLSLVKTEAGWRVIHKVFLPRKASA